MRCHQKELRICRLTDLHGSVMIASILSKRIREDYTSLSFNTQQDVEKVHQLCSRVVQKLNVQPNVCFAFSLAAASLDGLFERPAYYPGPVSSFQDIEGERDS